MPGAGGLVMVNHLYKVAKPDGLTIGMFVGDLVLTQLLGRPGVEADFLKFGYIGVPLEDFNTCALTKASGITSIEKWTASKTPVKLGSTAPGTTTDNIPRILREVLGLPIQTVGAIEQHFVFARRAALALAGAVEHIDDRGPCAAIRVADEHGGVFAFAGEIEGPDFPLASIHRGPPEVSKLC